MVSSSSSGMHQNVGSYQISVVCFIHDFVIFYVEGDRESEEVQWSPGNRATLLVLFCEDSSPLEIGGKSSKPWNTNLCLLKVSMNTVSLC